MRVCPNRFGDGHGDGDDDSASRHCPTSCCHDLPPLKGLELLYQPEAVRLYLSLLTCSQNHNTLEAAAGALQNLAAGQWAVSGRTLSHAHISNHPPPVQTVFPNHHKLKEQSFMETFYS